ncbi:uncharacterized protein si:dkey-27h10.2 isoform X3 [Alosa sapidissima]|uniref:uncharacterized protein si:dkey-27h10.2 isoform X3 n=1 Tax=Alosa sapidissima TaxID=34773 RepID=UPI001C07F5D1|nr:uncharacterized protein si:dkey-27h10.2 isoform X3 [Alosa sapidissima]
MVQNNEGNDISIPFPSTPSVTPSMRLIVITVIIVIAIFLVAGVAIYVYRDGATGTATGPTQAEYAEVTMKSMERLWAQCLWLLLLGVLVNIECETLSLGNSTADSVNNTFNSTTSASGAVPGITTTPLPSGNHTENSSTLTSSVTSVPATTPPSNTTTDTDRGNTTREVDKTATPTRVTKDTHSATTRAVATASQPYQEGNKAGYIILIIIIIAAILLVVYCCFKQNKKRRYSIDLRNKHEDAVIPLSTVEADAVFDTTPEKEMGTFTAQEAGAASPEAAGLAPEPTGEPEPAKGEPVAGEEKVTEAKVSGSQEPLTVDQKPEKMEVVDLTDGEPTVSTKTSVESLEDQLNDNNSNNYCTRANGRGFKGSVYEILQSDPF